METTSATTDRSSRRSLQFTTIDQVLDDVQQLATADANGALRCLGRWTFGQNLFHLAKWVDYSYDGVPLKLPFFVPWIMRPMKNRMLYKPMKPGSKIPRIPGGTLATDAVPTAEALTHFQTAFTRMNREVPSRPNLLFGPMTHAEWIALHLRHAELHLSFLRPD
jgi:hypothetical protein